MINGWSIPNGLVAMAAYASLMTFMGLSITRVPNTIHRNRIRELTHMALCCALAIISQAAPVLLPGIGMAISPLASLPPLLAVMIAPGLAFGILPATFMILTMISPEEAMVFLLMTGPTGLASGWAVAGDGFPWYKALMPGLTLAVGMSVLTNVAGFPPLGPATGGMSQSGEIALYTAFGLIYGLIWVRIALWVKKAVSVLSRYLP